VRCDPDSEFNGIPEGILDDCDPTESRKYVFKVDVPNKLRRDAKAKWDELKACGAVCKSKLPNNNGKKLQWVCFELGDALVMRAYLDTKLHAAWMDKIDEYASGSQRMVKALIQRGTGITPRHLACIRRSVIDEPYCERMICGAVTARGKVCKKAAKKDYCGRCYIHRNSNKIGFPQYCKQMDESVFVSSNNLGDIMELVKLASCVDYLIDNASSKFYGLHKVDRRKSKGSWPNKLLVGVRKSIVHNGKQLCTSRDHKVWFRVLAKHKITIYDENTKKGSFASLDELKVIKQKCEEAVGEVARLREKFNKEHAIEIFDMPATPVVGSKREAKYDSGSDSDNEPLMKKRRRNKDKLDQSTRITELETNVTQKDDRIKELNACVQKLEDDAKSYLDYKDAVDLMVNMTRIGCEGCSVPCYKTYLGVRNNKILKKKFVRKAFMERSRKIHPDSIKRHAKQFGKKMEELYVKSYDFDELKKAYDKVIDKYIAIEESTKVIYYDILDKQGVDELKKEVLKTTKDKELKKREGRIKELEARVQELEVDAKKPEASANNEYEQKLAALQESNDALRKERATHRKERADLTATIKELETDAAKDAHMITDLNSTVNELKDLMKWYNEVKFNIDLDYKNGILSLSSSHMSNIIGRAANRREQQFLYDFSSAKGMPEIDTYNDDYKYRYFLGLSTTGSITKKQVKTAFRGAYLAYHVDKIEMRASEYAKRCKDSFVEFGIEVGKHLASAKEYFKDRGLM